MDIESATQVQVNKGRSFARLTCCLGAFARNSRSKVINVTRSIKKIGQDNPRQLIHSIKIGIALTLVSCIYYWRLLYDAFGVAGIEAVLTVAVVFDFTVGATVCKSLNIGCGTLLAAALGLGGQHLAIAVGKRGEPVILGIQVFIIVATATFLRFFTKNRARYDYGVKTLILTFGLNAISGYREEQLFKLAHQKVSTVLIGSTTCMIINIFIYPMWASEDIHKLIASNIGKLANYLEDDKEETMKKVLEELLNLNANEESLANFARWEPGRGRFRFHHPWKQYAKIGALARKCAEKLETLNTYLDPEIQASLEFEHKIQEPCTKIRSEFSKALKAISSSVERMTDPSAAKCFVENSKTTIKDLTQESYSLPIARVAVKLEEITQSVEEIYEAFSKLSHLAHFKCVEPNERPPLGPLLHRGTINPVGDIDNADHVEIMIQEMATDSPEKKNALESCSLHFKVALESCSLAIARVAAILEEITKSVKSELSHLAHFKCVEPDEKPPTDSPEKKNALPKSPTCAATDSRH